MSEMLGSGSSELSGAAGNTSRFGQLACKPTTLAVLSQTKTSVFNQTTQPNIKLFGSTAAAPVFDQSGQKPTSHPKLEDSNAEVTSSLFGYSTATSASTVVSFGQQSASTGGRYFASSNSNPSFRQSKPVGTPLVRPSSIIFGAPQTSTAGTGICSASTTGSGSGKLSGAAGNTSEFGKPTALAVLSQTKTSVFNQITQPNAKLFGSTAVTPIFGQSGQKPTSHLKLEGSNAEGTSLLFGTPTATSASTEGSFSQKNVITGGNTGSGFFASSNSNTLLRQSKLARTPLAQPSSNTFEAPQTTIKDTGIFSANATGSGSGEFSGAAGNTSGFGQLACKPTTLAVLNQTKTSVFNQTTQPNTRLFGSTAAAPVFGQSGQKPTSHPKLEGSNAEGTSSLFGTPTATSESTGVSFGQQNTSMEGNRDSGFFNSIYSNTSFQQSKPVGIPLAQPSSTIFGAPQTSTASDGMYDASTTGTFAATSGFGVTPADGATKQFTPVTGTDTYVSNGVIHKINTSFQSITLMKEYETKAFEELRFEYYFANRKVEQQGTVGGEIFERPISLFSSTTTISTGLFGANDNKPLFGATSTIPAFGDVMMKIQLFAAPQTNIFGSTAPSTFDTQTTRFDQTVFRQPNQNNLFDQNKPAFGFESTQATGFGFGTNTSTSAHGLFRSKPSNTGFQITAPAFGTNNTFGTTSTAQPTTSLFNQTTNHLTGKFNNTARTRGKWRKNTKNE